MRDKTKVTPYEAQNIQIYAYSLPQIPSHEGCIKVGETTREVEKRIKEQLGTAGLRPEIHFTRCAQKKNGEWFHDKELHSFFLLNDIPKKDFGTGADEWFYFNGTPEKAEELTDKFINNDYDEVQINKSKYDYKLRTEQEEAVKKTIEYYNNFENEREFLWNAKPRFGKTLTTYDFIRRIAANNILIVTNRPAIANSWYDDFEKFIGWQETDMKFVSDSATLIGKTLSRENYLDVLNSGKDLRQIYFISLQDLKGSKVFGGNFDKYEWIARQKWDILIIDEAHEGVDTFKTDKAFSNIDRKFTLHLSGTPFKAIANQKFTEEQIYNWSYMDEQKAKKNWNISLDTNPYSNLPTLNMFTYQMSKMIIEKVELGYEFEDTNVDYAFDLSEFFKVENEKFVYEEDVLKFLDNLASNKFPFSLDEHRDKLNHTLWLLDRVASAKMLEKLLKKHPVFKYYKVVIAAGDGKSYDEEASDDRGQEKSLDRVRQAIRENERTITLSVGQLTTGVTIPEWTGVLMLNNVKSPALYFQAAFRAQNPYEYVNKNGELMRKENAYVFDFAPERTLILYDEFANNLMTTSTRATSGERKDNIQELLNFFPVIAEDENGSLQEINAEEVLTIPIKLKSQEVVKRGFMSNLLFANISSIFSAPAELKEILEKIAPEKQGRLGDKREIIDTKPKVDEYGEINISREFVINESNDLFGDKIFKTTNSVDIDMTNNIKDSTREAKEITKHITTEFKDIFDKFKDKYELAKNQNKKVSDAFENKIESKVVEIIERKNERIQDLEKKYEEQIKDSYSEKKLKEIKNTFEEEKTKIEKEIKDSIAKEVKSTVYETVEEQIERVETQKKKSVEDEVRDHLRGFARTIPAFLMAYGDKNTTLSNFEENIDRETFLDLTSITIEEFKKLRDGFEYMDEETGERKYISGLFDEVVFNSSVKEFFEIKGKLSNYFTNESEEDIFDYIPPQKTNQIFTPRRVVNMMLDTLEENDPEIFKNKNITFIDLYIKSGLYLTEIAKRLFKGLEKQIPFEEERIKWIFEKQLYGFAPSNIIYNISKNFIFGEFDYIKKKNIIECDLIPVVEDGKLKEKIKEVWEEEMKFDVIIGNPPYQENIGGENNNKSLAKQLFPLFIETSIGLNSEFISFIVPSRWFTADAQDKSFVKLRDFIKKNNHIKVLNHFNDTKSIFPNVTIAGGVNYFLYEKDYEGETEFNEHYSNNVIIKKTRPLFEKNLDIIISSNSIVSILHKIKEKDFESLTKITKGRNAFGVVGKLETLEKISQKNYFKDAISLRCAYEKIRYIKREEITKNTELIDRWKIFISKGNGGAGILTYGKEVSILGIPYLGEPNSVCTDSLIPIGDFKTKEEAENLIKYIRTKFLRFVVGILKVSQNVYQNVYQFVPLQNFTSESDINWSKSIEEIDEQLFDKYGLNEEEREHIRKSIKEM